MQHLVCLQEGLRECGGGVTQVCSAQKQEQERATVEQSPQQRTTTSSSQVKTYAPATA